MQAGRRQAIPEAAYRIPTGVPTLFRTKRTNKVRRAIVAAGFADQETAGLTSHPPEPPFRGAYWLKGASPLLASGDRSEA